jgi:hypothetical protein
MLWDPLNVWPRARWWLWAGLAVLVCAMQGPAFVSTLRPARTRLVDFFRDWTAARFVAAGLPAYANQQSEIVRYFGDPNAAQDDSIIERLTHPPVAVLVVLPFAGLDYPNATLAWNLLSLVALAASLWLIARGLDLRISPWAVLPLTALTLLCHPLREQQLNGQLNLVLLLLLVGTWSLERSGQPRWAGILLGTATALKLFPGFLLLYFVVRRQWAVVWSALACFAFLTGLSVLVLGAKAYETYFREVIPHLDGCRGYAYNASLVGFWSKLFDPGDALVRAWRHSPALARGAAWLSCAAVTAFALWLARRARTRTAADHAFAVAITAMLLVTPTVWHHYFLLLALPLALVWKCLPPTAFPRSLFMLICVLLWMHPMLWWKAFVADGFPGGHATPGHVVTILALQTYALLALFGMGTMRVLGQIACDENGRKTEIVSSAEVRVPRATCAPPVRWSME